MKAQERHQLKQNPFAARVAAIVDWFTANRDRAVFGGIATVVVVAVAGGYFWWRGHVREQAGALFGVAMAVAQAPIVPAPTVPGATQAPGTYPTDLARAEAAIRAFDEVIRAYPSTDAALAARYQAAAIQVSIGRLAEAQAGFEDVIARAGSSIYGPAARLGLAETWTAAGEYDRAIQALTDLAGQRDGPLPVDGILMTLARVSLKAGRVDDARATFRRIVDEFPQSGYVTEARKQLALIG